MKNGRWLFAALFLSLPAWFFGQVASDPLDYFYDDLVIWETMGIVNNLPQSRPYPLPLVKSILLTVFEKGDATQGKIAATHYYRFFHQPIHPGTKAELAIDNHSRKQLAIAISFDINFPINSLLSISTDVDGWATNKTFDQELLVEGQESTKDIVEDNARVGPFWILPSVNSSAGFGTTEYYVNAGLMRGSFGPFHSNGVIVGPQALHTAQYDFAINKEKWGYDLSLYSLAASSYGTYNATDNDFDTNYDEAEAWASGKYLTVHSIDYKPYDWLSVSLLESVVYGNTLDVSYLLPLSPFMINQGLTGFTSSCWLGGMFTVKPVKSLKIDGVFYADDLSFNDIIKLNFDTKWRFASQIGASYAPTRSGIFTLISLDYTAIMPYTYSHRLENENGETSDINYQNYTNGGKNMGADLEPNTDRINLKLKTRPLEDVDVDFIGTLIRHGNVNEDMDDKRIREYMTSSKYITDGTIFNSSYTAVGHAYNYSTPFLTQETLQYIWQTGFDVLCRLPVLKTGGQIVFKMGYRFEYNINSGINSQLWKYHGSTTIDDSTYEAKKAAQLEAWREEAKGTVVNHYISAGFEVFY